MEERVLPKSARFARREFRKRRASSRKFQCREPSHARLSGANLSFANLIWSKLRNADLQKASLTCTEFTAADLTHADFREAFLPGAVLRRSSLNQANLSGGLFFSLKSRDIEDPEATAVFDVLAADFSWADLTNTDLTEATISGVTFGSNDLSTAKGLETIRHQGPSVVDVNTILRSRGRIPDIFLRGVGIPEEIIIYAKSLALTPVEFYSCFISYSTNDQAFSDRLYADLQANGVRCWFAQHNIQGGRKIHEQIDEAIRVYDRLLLIP